MVTERHNPKRRNMLGENRLVSEWVLLAYPGRAWHRHFRVGGNPELLGLGDLEPEELQVIRNRNRWVDLVVEPPPDLVVVEAKMWDASNGIGKLKEYLAELPFTPEYIAWGRPPVRAVVLTAQHDPLAQMVIEDAGIEYVWWEPPWIGDWYALYPERRRKAAASSVVDALRGLRGPPER